MTALSRQESDRQADNDRHLLNRSFDEAEAYGDGPLDHDPTMPSLQDQTGQTAIKYARPRLWTSFFIFGLLNNVLYVIILSAALDLVPASTPKGTVAFFNIFPALLAKTVWPYLSRGDIRYHRRIYACTVCSWLGMVVSLDTGFVFTSPYVLKLICAAVTDHCWVRLNDASSCRNRCCFLFIGAWRTHLSSMDDYYTYRSAQLSCLGSMVKWHGCRRTRRRWFMVVSTQSRSPMGSGYLKCVATRVSLGPTPCPPQLSDA